MAIRMALNLKPSRDFPNWRISAPTPRFSSLRLHWSLYFRPSLTGGTLSRTVAIRCSSPRYPNWEEAPRRSFKIQRDAYSEEVAGLRLLFFLPDATATMVATGFLGGDNEPF